MVSFLRKYCSKEWLEFIDFHKTTIDVPKKSLIFQAGDQMRGFYVIRSGKAKVIAKDNEGKERLVRLAADGDIIGHRGFGGNWKYPISAIALENSTITFLPLNVFETIAKSNVEFTYQLMMFFAEELRTSEENNASLPVLARVSKAIYINYKAFGFEEGTKKLNFTLSRKDYASMSGTTYESVIRSIATLNSKKIIKIEGKTIHILKLETLKNMSLAKD